MESNFYLSTIPAPRINGKQIRKETSEWDGDSPQGARGRAREREIKLNRHPFPRRVVGLFILDYWDFQVARRKENY